MKRAEKPRQVAAHVLLIGSKLPQAFGGSFKHGGIGRALIAADEAAKRLRDGEGDHEACAGEGRYGGRGAVAPFALPTTLWSCDADLATEMTISQSILQPIQTTLTVIPANSTQIAGQAQFV